MLDPLRDLPLRELLRRADKVGVGFRLQGRAVEVRHASRLPLDLDCALQSRCAELWDYLGGTVLDRPPIELLASLGVAVIVPRTIDEAHAALAAIETDSNINTPAELLDRPPLIGFDVETAALPGTEQRPPVKLTKAGIPWKLQPSFNSVAALDPQRSRIRLVQLYGGGRSSAVPPRRSHSSARCLRSSVDRSAGRREAPVTSKPRP